MNCGVYKIINTTNGKVYIGSSKNLDRRWKEHFYILINNKCVNIYLQRSWNKYGEDSFVFEVLLYCNKENLAFYEQRTIDVYKSLDNKYGYNICLAARSDLTGNNAEERNRKISETAIKNGKNRGKNSSWYGKNHTEETKQKISESHMGMGHTEETKQKLSELVMGRKHTQETRKKLSKLFSGENHPMFGIVGEKHPNFGKKFPEHSKRMSGKNNPSAKAVTINGKHYDTITEAAQDLKIQRCTVRNRIKANKPGYRNTTASQTNIFLNKRTK